MCLIYYNICYSWEFNDENSKRGGGADKCIPYQLQRLFLQMQTSNQRSVETTPVTRSFGWDSSHCMYLPTFAYSKALLMFYRHSSPRTTKPKCGSLFVSVTLQ